MCLVSRSSSLWLVCTVPYSESVQSGLYQPLFLLLSCLRLLLPVRLLLPGTAAAYTTALTQQQTTSCQQLHLQTMSCMPSESHFSSHGASTASEVTVTGPTVQCVQAQEKTMQHLHSLLTRILKLAPHVGPKGRQH